MSTAVALRHQARPVASTRTWPGQQLAPAARLRAPSIRRVARDVGDPGDGVVLAPPEEAAARPLAVVARLWLGVLSIFTLIVVGGLLLIILGAWVFGYRPVVVTSGSMAPVIRTGDVVITRPIHMHDKVGDQTVIDFEDPVTGERHLHRVIEVSKAGYRTKGDANGTADPSLVPQDHIHGAGFVLAPFVGYFPLWVQQRAWPQLGLVVLVLVGLIVMSRKGWMWAWQR